MLFILVKTAELTAWHGQGSTKVEILNEKAVPLQLKISVAIRSAQCVLLFVSTDYETDNQHNKFVAHSYRKEWSDERRVGSLISRYMRNGPE